MKWNQMKWNKIGSKWNKLYQITIFLCFVEIWCLNISSLKELKVSKFQKHSFFPKKRPKFLTDFWTNWVKSKNKGTFSK